MDQTKFDFNRPPSSAVNPAQAQSAGWVIDAGDPGAWVTMAKAHNDRTGMMKSTKCMSVTFDGYLLGWLYQVTTEGPKGYAEALTYVPNTAGTNAADHP